MHARALLQAPDYISMQLPAPSLPFFSRSHMPVALLQHQDKLHNKLR
jgi:hypothetical protein